MKMFHNLHPHCLIRPMEILGNNNCRYSSWSDCGNICYWWCSLMNSSIVKHSFSFSKPLTNIQHPSKLIFIRPGLNQNQTTCLNLFSLVKKLRQFCTQFARCLDKKFLKTNFKNLHLILPFLALGKCSLIFAVEYRCLIFRLFF